jgi:hypothetical protein
VVAAVAVIAVPDKVKEVVLGNDWVQDIDPLLFHTLSSAVVAMNWGKDSASVGQSLAAHYLVGKAELEALSPTQEVWMSMSVVGEDVHYVIDCGGHEVDQRACDDGKAVVVHHESVAFFASLGDILGLLLLADVVWISSIRLGSKLQR